MINATKKWIFLKVSGVLLIPLMVWFILNLIKISPRSFGKGSVQTITPLGWDGALRLTTALYYLPSGRTIQGHGVVPDIGITGGGKDSSMLYLKGVQTEKLNNNDIVSKIVNLVEKKAEEIEIKK